MTQEAGSSHGAFAQIVKRSADWPRWQQDALRRLCKKDALNETDITELLALCKENQGDPITEDDIPDPAALTAKISLSKLHNVQHVNALEPNQELCFEREGLTIIYGDNGAGKSGYARILKHACRARDSQSILSNIHASPSAPPQIPQAIILYNLDNKEEPYQWQADQSTDPRLTAIHVFDSHIANIHIDKDNELAYTPAPLRMLEKLAQSCDKIEKSLGAETEQIKSQTPKFLQQLDEHVRKYLKDTAVEKCLDGADNFTEAETEVETWTVLSAGEKERLSYLATEYSKDPRKAAQDHRNWQEQIDEAKQRLIDLEQAVSQQSIDRLQQLHKADHKAQEAAELGSKKLFSHEPLPDVGSEIWKELWKAARAYSAHHAYPGYEFPVTDEVDKARCVLCHQQLSPEASTRLKSFEEFVSGELQKHADKARQDYTNAYQSIENPSRSAESPKYMEMICQIREISRLIGDAQSAKIITRWAIINAQRRRSIRRAGPDAPVMPPADAQAAIAAMTKLEDNLKAQAKAYSEEADAPERKELEDQYKALDRRRWQSEHKGDMLAQIQRLKHIHHLEQKKKDTQTDPITRLSSKLSDQLVTDKLRKHFADEVKQLEIANHDKIELKPKGGKGRSSFRVWIADNKDAGKILSEGERRCVALAMFLAELSCLETQSGIVFDDPVSSLDHINREKIAQRLAKEGATRQVIIFTHDQAFLHNLKAACKKKSQYPRRLQKYLSWWLG